jgi:CRP-like cAMP-binding protein
LSLFPALQNRLLASLPASEMSALAPHLSFIDLPQATVLFETGDTIRQVYFPHSGIVSLLVNFASGEMIETAMVGRDSLVGGLAALNEPISLSKAVVQVAGQASTMDTAPLCQLAEQSVSFRTTIIRHQQIILAQAQQSAACNAIHDLAPRLCRLLLRCHDLLESDDVALTQDFLAHMLGVQRSSLTSVANILQRAGSIRCSRGHIHIQDVATIKECACECYEAVRAQSRRLMGSGMRA